MSLQTIRRRLNNSRGYHSLVEGVSTFDTAQMFTDMRELLVIIGGQSKLADDLAAIQQAVRGIREDYRDYQDGECAAGLDERLNKIESYLGECVSRARGE